MLLVNLKILLAERNITITKLAAITGISRTTITALCANTSQGVQFDTLNKLFTCLKVTPADFFCYSPYNYTIDIDGFGETLYANIKIFNQQKDNSAVLLIGVEVSHSELFLSISTPEPEDEDTKYENSILESFYNTLPQLARTKFEDDVIDAVLEKMNIEPEIEIITTWNI